MSEARLGYERILNESEILRVKEDTAFAAKHQPQSIDGDVPAEVREKGQELQSRVKDLYKIYENKHGFNRKNLISDNTVESLTACLEPQRAEYVLAHLKELDALSARAEFEARMLPKAEQAIETWEKLAGELPTDLVEDGLRVDAYAFMNLKQYIANLKNPVITAADQKRAEIILERLHQNNPRLVNLAEGMESLEVEED